MKLILTNDEVVEILLEHVNRRYATNFNACSYDRYFSTDAATFETKEVEAPKQIAVPYKSHEVQE